MTHESSQFGCVRIPYIRIPYKQRKYKSLCVQGENKTVRDVLRVGCVAVGTVPDKKAAGLAMSRNW